MPAAAVVIRDGRSYVAKVQSAGTTATVALQSVRVGRRQMDRVEILGGLQSEDRIVVQGAAFLNDGDVVRIVAAGPGGT